MFLLLAGPTAAPANTLAIFRTSLGPMAVELFDEDKPVTVYNFIRLARFGAYRNTFFHRCETGFVAQAGGFVTASAASTNAFPGNYSPTFSFGAISNEYAVGPVISNTFGTIAMAKVSGQPDSATSQFFFNLNDNSVTLAPPNNGGFTVFGRVIAGSNVLHQLMSRTLTEGLLSVTDTVRNVVFPTLPVTYSGDRMPQINELIYTGIEIMRLIIQPQPDESRLLAWNSPTGLVCHVEYRDDATAATWDSLYVTNGNGQVQAILDDDPPPAARQYRIRVTIPEEPVP